MHQDGAAVLGGDTALACGSCELLLEGFDDLGRVVARLRVGNRSERSEGRLVGVVDDREVVPVVYAQRALFSGRKTDRHHHVQVQARQVD